MKQLPEYQSKSLSDGMVQIDFNPPVTKATLGIPFSFLVMQEPETTLATTRFGRVERITCEAGRWVSYMKTYGLPEEEIEGFKKHVGYVPPEPIPAPQAEEAPAGQ